ncbi:MAG: hypothetical protein WBE75_03380 [Candidatus Omnitrophota bacterium]|jgi:hypothetical protein
MSLLKRLLNWQVLLGAGLLSLSALGYFLHYLIFHDARHIFIYLLGDISFVFIEVLLVTLIIHQLLSYRERKTMLRKLNMVIGVFYSEAGIALLRFFAAADARSGEISRRLILKPDWSRAQFEALSRDLKTYDSRIDSSSVDLTELRQLLVSRRAFLLGLLGNPNLLEHDSFSNLLWAVFHLTEELSAREKHSGLPDKDYEHLSGDMKRAYSRLLSEWLDYMRHLKADYPYLFSLAVRMNPFDPSASVLIK